MWISLLISALFLVWWAGTSGYADNKPSPPKTPEPPPRPASADPSVDPFEGLLPMKATGQEVFFNFRPGPRPPGDIGVKERLPFPPPEPKTKPKAAPKVEAPALKVVRITPKGGVSMIKAISVTFNQPMIPLSSLSDTKTQPIPVKLKPLPPGRWRWLGTTTLTYEVEGRYPYSTNYSIEIPKGTQSLQKKTLPATERAAFSTPTLQMETAAPSAGSTIPLTSSFAILFNQDIRHEALASALVLRGPSGNHPFEIVPAEQWKEIKDISYVHTWDKKRTLVIRPLRPLRKDASYTFALRPGAYSAEGPRPTSKTLYLSFRTYGPLKIISQGCWETQHLVLFKRCRPEGSLYVHFSNPLKPTQDLQRLITIEPSAPKFILRNYGSSIHLTHPEHLPAAKTVTLRFNAALEDIYGQTLEIERRATFHTGDLQPKMELDRQGIATIEHGSKPELNLTLRNIRSFRRSLRILQEADLTKIARWTQHIQRYAMTPPDLAWDSDQIFSSPGPWNQENKRLVDLEVVLKGRPGLVFVWLHSSDLQREYRWNSPSRLLVVQVTQIGLAVRYGPEKIIALANQLSRGEPAVVSLSLIPHDLPNQATLTGQTSKDGLAVFPGARELQKRIGKTSYLLLARKGDDRSFVTIDNGGSDAKGYTSGYNPWSNPPPDTQFQYFLTPERDPHKPGETVHLRGIIRQRQMRPLGGLLGLEATATEVKYKLYSPRWQILQEGSLPLGKGGIFALSYPIPEDGDLGRYSFQGTVVSGVAGSFSVHGSFQVQAYRTPEYKVSAKAEAGPFFVGQKVNATVEGRYTFGAPMAGADLTWVLRRQEGSFRPPKQPAGFHFGPLQSHHSPWGYRRGHRGSKWGGYYHSQTPGTQIAQGSGKLSPQGIFHTVLSLEDATSRYPLHYTFEAQVFDQNRQAIAARTTLLAHRSGVSIGLKTKKPLAKAKQPFLLDVIASDLQGKRIEKLPIEIHATETTWKKSVAASPQGKETVSWKEVEESLASCKVTSSDRIEECSLTIPKAGHVILVAKAQDGQGRWAETRLGLYVAGDGYVAWKSNDPENLELVADQEEYPPGATAQILIKSPFKRAWGLLTLERHGIAEHYPLKLEGSAQTVPIPLRREYLPNVHLAVLLVRGRDDGKTPAAEGPETTDQDDRSRPAFAFGQTNLKVKLTEKQIAVQAIPTPAEIRPGGKLALQIATRDHQGQPLPAFVSVAIVDEGVLSLFGFQTPDPLKAFYTEQPSQTVLRDLRLTLLARKKKPKAVDRSSSGAASADRFQADELRAGGGRRYRPMARSRPLQRLSIVSKQDAAKSIRADLAEEKKSKEPPAENERSPARQKGQQALPMEAAQLRTNFLATAFYQGSVETNERGEATLSVPMPDNLTTFRVMVVAVDPADPSRFGNGEASVVVRKPLLLRPSLPRFANYGDRFEASVVINNESKASGAVRVMARAVNLALEGVSSREVTIPAGESREIRFPVRVLQIGKGRIQFAAVMDSFRDAVEVSIPVLIPATAEAFATYGTTQTSIAQTVLPPKDALPQFGGLQLSVSSTALNGLEDAVRYLIDYPFECVEQTASRAMPIFALHRILPEFRIAKIEDQKAMKALASDAIRKLVRTQRHDGGWGYWSGSSDSWMWISGYATYALLRGQEAGYNVPSTTLDRAFSFLQQRLRSPHRWEKRAYATHVMAAWVLSERKQAPGDRLSELYGLKKKLPLFASAWLMQALHRQGADDPRIGTLAQALRNRAEETASAIRFAEARTESLRLLMHSNDRTDAILLSAFLDVRPNDPMIPKIVRGLLQARIRGRWMTTQSNAFAMLALARYYALYEKETPAFTVQTWLGDGFLNQIPMQGRSMKVVEQTVPMGFLQAQGSKPLVIAKAGPGRLYYRLGLRYAPKDLRLKAEEQGFAIRRTYEPIDNDSVRKDAEGRWIFRAGTYSRVRLQITAPGQRYFVAVIDPLPAGLEGVNFAFQTSASTALASASDHRIYDSRTWYSLYAFNHKEMRDEMATLFADRLPAGIYEYTYVVRATTLGSFVIPPSRIEEMYQPETFGRSDTMFAVVE